jgi:hypothetical protein
MGRGHGKCAMPLVGGLVGLNVVLLLWWIWCLCYSWEIVSLWIAFDCSVVCRAVGYWRLILALDVLNQGFSGSRYVGGRTLFNIIILTFRLGYKYYVK